MSKTRPTVWTNTQAAVVIHDAHTFNKRRRQSVATWLRDQADRLEKDFQDYDHQYSAFYMVKK